MLNSKLLELFLIPFIFPSLTTNPLTDPLAVLLKYILNLPTSHHLILKGTITPHLDCRCRLQTALLASIFVIVSFPHSSLSNSFKI